MPIHLLRNGGEQNSAAYRAINPQARVPTLVLADGTALIQSASIIEYLEEIHPHPALLPSRPVKRAQIRGVAALIGSDIHPLNNLSVLNRLRAAGHDEAAISCWIQHWIERGLAAVERLIDVSGWCFGAAPGLADVYLVPQVVSARRFGIELDAFPHIRRVEALAAQHPAFIRADPAHQPDSG